MKLVLTKDMYEAPFDVNRNFSVCLINWFL